jgi:hypothetical protein
VYPHLFVNKNAALAADDVSDLKALNMKNAANVKTAKKQLSQLLDMLKRAKLLTKESKKTISGLTGLAADPIVELLRATPELVEYDWFMARFGLTNDGLGIDTGSLQTWGRALTDHLLPLLTNKIPSKFSFLSKPISNALTAASKYLVGQSWSDQVEQLMKKLLDRKTPGTMTLKLFETSYCGLGTTCLGGVAAGNFGLYMAFSVTPLGALEFYASPNPIGYNPNDWIKDQCLLGCQVSTPFTNPTPTGAVAFSTGSS